jgi:small redox-active disulfide protein 2
MVIKILGTGCPNCINLEKSARKAVEELNLGAEVVKESEITRIISYGVMRTPALVIDEKVMFSGKIPSFQELKEIIHKQTLI